MENKEKEIILKLNGIDVNGDITTGEMMMMLSEALYHVCNVLETEVDDRKTIDNCLGMFIHSIIADKTDEEIAKIFTQAELIRRDYDKFMKNNLGDTQC